MNWKKLFTYVDDDGFVRQRFEKSGLTGAIGFRFSCGGYFKTQYTIQLRWGFGGVIITLPWSVNKSVDDIGATNYNEYGIEYNCSREGISSSLWIYKGKSPKIIYMPWTLDWYRTTFYDKNGKKYTDKHMTSLQRRRYWKMNGTCMRDYIRAFMDTHRDMFYETYDYTYVLKSGEVQKRKATIHVEEMEWRRLGMMWLPLFTRTRKYIEIEFDEEVGERSGSWKGGVVGTSCEMLEGETPEQTLRRFEKTEKM